MTETEADPTFAILAEHKQSERPLIMSGLTFGRLMDEIVLPYDSNEPFFIDGVPTLRADLKRIKIVRESDALKHRVSELHWKLPRESTGRNRQSCEPVSHAARSHLPRIENKIEAVIGQGAREGKTISTEKVLSRVEELKSSYTGPDREAFVEEIDRVMTEVREKYGPEIPVDEAYRLQKELERKQAD